LLLSVEPPIILEDHEIWLKAAASRRLPLFTPSADAQSVSLGGVSAGLSVLTGEYSRLGGAVTLVGKPEKTVYDACRRRLGSPHSTSKIVAIGDQIGSDILGAKRFGFDAALVATGAAETHLGSQILPAEALSLACNLAAEHGTTLDWVMPSFKLSGSSGEGHHSRTPSTRA
jgi:ribonucleotide monophosphatase NagD (HAD superfamily)